ncbi:MAG TPA: hypothetical protein VHW23_17445 [Kofleriaceae bacterium]|jgi:hypothetical protein|nr:hypothetical protein [Kofleriaceae bacterium]
MIAGQSADTRLSLQEESHMRSTPLCLSLALVALGATAGGCAVTDGDSEDSQTAQVTAAPAVSPFVLTVTGIESEDVASPTSDNFCDSTCNYAFLGGTPLTITAVGSAADCLTFSSWEGACAGQPRVCHIVINSDLSITARFRPPITGCKPQ